MIHLERGRYHAQRFFADIGQPGLIGVALAAAALVFYIIGIRTSENDLQQMQERLVRLQQQSERAAGQIKTLTPDEQLARFYASFPEIDAAPDVLARMFRLAFARGLELEQGEYRAVREPSARLTRYEMVLPLKGSYPQVRAFLASALREIPVMSLEDISFQRPSIDRGMIETKVNLTLYLGEAI